MRVLTFLGLLAFTSWLTQDRLEAMVIYPFDGRAEAPETVDLPGVTAQNVERGDDTLVIWTAPPKAGKPVIFYLHGNAGNLADRAGRFRRFLARGYGLVAPAYRGSSGSTGTPSEAVITEDIAALWQTWPKLIPAPRGAHPPVIVYGESLGTGVAVVALLSKARAQPDGVILEAPYTSIPDVAAHSYPQLAPLADLLQNRWPSLDHARAITMPLLVIHGTDDALIPQSQGRAVFAAAVSRDKDFLNVGGGAHTTLWRSDVLPRMWRFIDAYGKAR